MLLAYGAVVYRAEHLRLELDELAALADETGGEVIGLDALDEMVAEAEARRAMLTELMPSDAPHDLVAVGFAALFDEYERKVREVGRRLNPRLSDDDVPRLRRQFEAICVTGPPPFDVRDAPALTRDPADDPIVYGALLADADYLVSDDRDVVGPDEERAFEHADHRTVAMTFGRFISEQVSPPDLAWDQIDGGWIKEALRRRSLGG